MKIGSVRQKSGLKSEIDLLNVFFCAAVIAVHLLSEAVEALARGTFEHTFAFAFQRMLFCAVYGFIFLSAEKTALNEDKNIGILSFYRRRIVKIVLPYVTAVLIYYIFMLFTGKVKFSLSSLVCNIITGNLTAHFYFVPVIVQFYVLAPLFKYIFEKCNVKIVLFAALVLNLSAAFFLCGYDFYSRTFLKYLFCYVLGYCAGKNYERYIRLTDKFGILLFVYVFSLCAELAASYAAIFGGTRAVILQQTVTALYMPAAVMFWYAAATRLSRLVCGRLSRAIGILSRSSYYVYLWHILFIMAADILLNRPGISGIFRRFCIRGTVTLICSACIPAFLYIKQGLKRRG